MPLNIDISLDTGFYSLSIRLYVSSIKLLIVLKATVTNAPDVLNNRIQSYPLSSIMPVKTFVQRSTLRDSIREQLLRELDDDREGETKRSACGD